MFTRMSVCVNGSHTIVIKQIRLCVLSIVTLRYIVFFVCTGGEVHVGCSLFSHLVQIPVLITE